MQSKHFYLYTMKAKEREHLQVIKMNEELIVNETKENQQSQG